MEASEAIIVSLCHHIIRAFHPFHGPSNPRELGGGLSLHLPLSVPGTHWNLSPKGWPGILMATDVGGRGRTRTKYTLAVSWRRRLMASFLP